MHVSLHQGTWTRDFHKVVIVYGTGEYCMVPALETPYVALLPFGLLFVEELPKAS
jgi:hypothetical protein